MEDNVCVSNAVDAGDTSSSAIDQQITKILQQNQRDLMYELRRLQHKERVVTQYQQHFQTVLDAVVLQRVGKLGCCGDEKEAVAPAAGDEQADMEHQTHAPRANAPRPAEVLDEMQNLVEQRPVTHLLSSNFRTLLEEAVGESTSRILQLRSHHRQQRPRFLPIGNASSTQHSSGSRGHGVTANPAVPPPVMPRREVVGHQHAHIRPARRPIEQLLQRGTGQPQPADQEQRQEVERLAQIERQQQEEIILEVEEIMHHQVVTAVLASEFRNVLEHHMEERLQQAGGNGEQVQQFVRSLAMEQRPAAAGRQPRGMSSADVADVANLRADVRQLTQTVSELERLMKLSFDLHLDNQRVLRQEMAAVAHSVHADQGQSSVPNVTTAIQSGMCVVCHTAASDCTFYRCGHLCTCSQCAHDLHARPNPICPICRASVEDIIRVYPA